MVMTTNNTGMNIVFELYLIIKSDNSLIYYYYYQITSELLISIQHYSLSYKKCNYSAKINQGENFTINS